MQKILSKQYLSTLTLILYVLSVFLDLHIFYNSISTLIRTVVISLLFIIIFIKFSNKKERRLFYIYFIFLGIYIILHLYNSSNFTNKLEIYYSNLDEILYFYKMVMNSFIIYIVYKLNINLNSFIKYMKICLWFICGSIVFCNIFKLGYTTYDFIPLINNIFSWFNNHKYSYIQISGKGYFHLANQVIAIILLYFPLLLNEIKEKIKVSDIFLSIILLLSMLILGNRISSVAPLITLVVALIMYLIMHKKSQLNLKYLIYLIIVIFAYNIFLSHSPLLNRELYYRQLKANIERINEKYDTVADNLDDEDIENLFVANNVNLNFPLSYYPYNKDKEFWNNMLKKNPGLLIDSRYLEISITKRLIELNNNPLDHYLGISYTRIINIVNIERDYIMQYYSIGIIGLILLLGCYFIIYTYSIFKIGINLEAKCTYKNIMLCLALSMFLLVAYFSGNLLNAISTIIPLSFVLGIFLNEVRIKKNITEKILGFNICNLSQDEIIENVFKDMRENKNNIIFNINPLIMVNFYKNKKIVREFNKEKYQIPDGIGTIISSKMKDGSLNKRITGIDIFESICKKAASENKKIFLYGGKEGIAEKTKKNLLKKYPELKIVGTLNGYINEKVALKEILKAKPDILFVALGSPKQELFIINNKNKLKSIKLMMPVGGTFDVLSGSIKRAPKLFVKCNLEWVYRMIKEPKRIIRNFNIIKFIMLVIFKNNCYN